MAAISLPVAIRKHLCDKGEGPAEVLKIIKELSASDKDDLKKYFEAEGIEIKS